MKPDNATDLTKMINSLEEVIRFMDNFQELKVIKNEIVEVEKDFRNLLDKHIEHIQVSKAYMTILEELVHNKLYLIDKTTELEKHRDFFVNLQEKLSNLAMKYLEGLSIISQDTTLRVRKLETEPRIHWFKNWSTSEYKTEYFKPIITAFCNWEYPVMELYPGVGNFLPFALGGEPLYIVDTDQYLLDKCAEQFNEFYANKRLMKYKTNGQSLSLLPQNSFGFIYNLNYSYAEDDVSNYNTAKEVLNCLMPGGTYLFSYIPSDKWWGVEVMENKALNGLDTRTLVSSLELTGFVDVKVVYDTAMTTHILARKPGEIEYIKGSSILAKIIDKPSDLM